MNLFDLHTLRRPSLLFCLLFAASAAHAQAIGEVDTVFKWLGPDHKIVVDAFDDPKVKGVTCYVSRAKTGGIKGGLGLAEDKSDASIECKQVGAVSFVGDPLKQQEVVFTERTSLVFKKLQVVRMVDKARNTLVYLSYSDRVIEGSPDNSITAVPLPPGTAIPMR
ncbi:CreA family protein [Hydrogenophaga sp.]|uniref:CreA family protein n=1 Tax=Hydrogenophaga sp. TaxID=1904254 RepID=UPI00272FD338|nr:CreA family protein [Hydrogenophaga sp.]MDP2019222.1 CreA family protein [Hydrogenophaga sp.]MDP3167950.1 CreA family protein [Hydrogenophaga sp.]MDP3809799.1 CreA family protein [Hydrogenophaga sp.]